ncbi:peptidylprolyl isomerase [Sporosarcina sp. E16_3]|uniref:peptidylprolyl isomerase n=1 Tax=Sporosarcina sp. E16_3 TaxID=2789293 RepID=UPI001A91DE83|nr:peptidylprolyl isomerase [Sporosarcina sp. E16_3]MBO0600899.1 peptidylprolyl isomerase [Sporosarcina sp. E16_3]
MRKKRLFPLLTVSLLAIILTVTTGCSKDSKASTDETVATIGDEKITKDELYEVLVQSAGQEALTAMIDDKVVALELKKEKVSVSDKEVDAELAIYVENAGGQEAFDAALKTNAMTEKEFKENIVDYLSIRKIIEPRIKITDEDIKAYFEENKESFNEEEQVAASHILVEDEATAKKVAKKLADGEDFATLAKEFSTDTMSAENGGELGLFPRGKMVAEFEEAAFSMKVDAISDPIKTEHGYHIIHVTDKKAAKEAVLSELKGEIKGLLLEEGVQAEYVNWLDEVKLNYKIENSLLTK